MKRSTKAAIDLGVFGLVLAGVLAFRPEVVPVGPVRSILAGVDPAPLLRGIGGVVGLYALWRVRPAERRLEPLETRDPETAATMDGEIAGASFDDRLARIVGDRRSGSDLAAEDEEDLRMDLRELAVAVRRRSAGESRETAVRAIEAGEWTDDERAAAFLGGPDAPEPSLPTRLYDYLRRRDTFELRVEHAVEAIRDELDADGGKTRD